MSKCSRLYTTWYNMRRRCNNPNNKDFKNYGARGICVCDEWNNSFSSFKEWALLNGYNDKLTIDRIDNNGAYCPANCRWVGMDYNSVRRRNTKLITFNGITKPLKTWAKEFGLSGEGLRYRIKVLGLSVEEAFRGKEERWWVKNLPMFNK